MKILVIRFSSLGDVLQTLSVPGRLREIFPDAEIHWLTRSDYNGLIEHHPAIKKTWLIRKGQGLRDILALAQVLKNERFTHIYDAHNNLRSRIICASLNGLLGWRRAFRHRFLRRSIFRWKRFLLFRFRINRFERPFSGQRDLLKPLEKWGVPFALPQLPQLYLSESDRKLAREKLQKLSSPRVALAPSAAFELKRWPIEYFQKLIELLPNYTFVVLGGKEDTFLEKLVIDNSDRVVNWAGQMTFSESAAVVTQCDVLVSNDTGLMHVAEQTGVPCVALMGPAPFGFPSRPRTKIMELNLACRPCSKHGQGPCINPTFQLCLRGIAPESVYQEVLKVIDA